MRVIGPDGKQIGILERNEALKIAQDKELDLVEIAPKANPPVAKIIDFEKFRYEQEKKAREERKREKKGTTLKEVWFTPLIGESDYQVRLGRVKEFLEEKDKVRITVKPKRRLPTTAPLYRVLERIIKDLEGIAKTEQEPKMAGRQLVTLVVPAGGVGENTTKKEENLNESSKIQNEDEKSGKPPL